MWKTHFDIMQSQFCSRLQFSRTQMKLPHCLKLGKAHPFTLLSIQLIPYYTICMSYNGRLLLKGRPARVRRYVLVMRSLSPLHFSYTLFWSISLCLPLSIFAPPPLFSLSHTLWKSLWSMDITLLNDTFDSMRMHVSQHEDFVFTTYYMTAMTHKIRLPFDKPINVLLHITLRRW